MKEWYVVRNVNDVDFQVCALQTPSYPQALSRVVDRPRVPGQRKTLLVRAQLNNSQICSLSCEHMRLNLLSSHGLHSRVIRHIHTQLFTFSATLGGVSILFSLGLCQFNTAKRTFFHWIYSIFSNILNLALLSHSSVCIICIVGLQVKILLQSCIVSSLFPPVLNPMHVTSLMVWSTVQSCL